MRCAIQKFSHCEGDWVLQDEYDDRSMFPQSCKRLFEFDIAVRVASRRKIVLPALGTGRTLLFTSAIVGIGVLVALAVYSVV